MMTTLSYKVLLDTQSVVWANLTPERLTQRAAATIQDPAAIILVSVASAWEISTKVRLGKMPGVEVFEREFLQLPERAGYTLLPIYADVALRSGRLVGRHGDPFDRMIAAQALALDIPVISNDAKLDGFGVRRIW